MAQHTHDAVIEIYGHEFEVTVKYDYYPGSRGKREAGTGLPLEPDEFRTVEFVSAETKEGERLQLPKIVVTELEEDIVEEHYND